MDSSFLTIKEAAAFIGKAEVTIRRLLKRLLSNRTNETDRCIIESTEHGKRLYRIEPRFLVKHANLNAATRERLLHQLDQMATQMTNDQALNTQVANLPNQSPAQMNSGSESATTRNDRKTTQVNKLVDQTTSQANVDQTNDKANDQSPDQTAVKVSRQQTDVGSRVLEKAIDELSNQLNVKDKEIDEKNKQLAARDKTIDGLNESILKLTSGIEQGNFLVASAQQRIPLPDDAKRETIPDPDVVQVNDSPQNNNEKLAKKNDSESTKRGLWQSIAARFQRSDI